MGRPAASTSHCPRIAAHRGASAHAVENSLHAMQVARAQGADGAEFDVHATADGAFVVYHDPVIAGLGPISDLPASRVLTHRLADQSTIPTLAAVLGELGGLDAWVEIKGLAATWDEALIGVLEAASATSRIAVHAFDHRIVRRLQQRASWLETGVLQASYPLDPLAAARAVGATMLWQSWELIDEALVAAALDAAIGLVAWTVPTPEIARLAALGVDVVCVNAPDAARAVLSSPRSP